MCHTKHVNIVCRHKAEFLVFNLTVNTQDYWFIWQIPFVVSCRLQYCTELGCRSHSPSPPCGSEGLNVHRHRQSSVAWWSSSRWRWLFLSSQRNATSQNDIYILFCLFVSCSVSAPRIIGPIYFWDYKFTPMICAIFCTTQTIVQASYDRLISKELCPSSLLDLKLCDFELCGASKDRACNCNHRLKLPAGTICVVAVTRVWKPNRIVYSTFCNSDE